MFNAVENKNEKNLKQDAKKIGQDVKQAKKDAEKLADRSLNQIMHDAGSKVRQFADRGIHKAEEVGQEAKERITRKPFQAVSVAAAAGLVLGFLLRGRK